MKNIKSNRPELVCMPFSGVTPFHKKTDKAIRKNEVKADTFPPLGGCRFF